MSWYAVYRSTDGELLGEGSQIPDPMPADRQAKAFADRPAADRRWNAVDLDYTTIVEPPPSAVSSLEFLKRFTQVERVAIRGAAKSDPALEDFLDLIDKANEIRLNDPDTIAGVQYVVSQGLLSAGRASEVLG